VCLEDDENSIWAIKKIKLDGDDELRACVLNEIDLLVALRGVCLRERVRALCMCACVRVCVLNEIELLVALRGVCLRGRERVCLVCVYVCRGSSWCVCVSESVWGV